MLSRIFDELEGSLIQLWNALERASKAVEEAVKLAKDVHESMAKPAPAGHFVVQRSVRIRSCSTLGVRQPRPSRVWVPSDTLGVLHKAVLRL